MKPQLFYIDKNELSLRQESISDQQGAILKKHIQAK